MELFTKSDIPLANGFLIPPVWRLIFHLGPHDQRLLAYGLKFFGKGIGLLAGERWGRGNNDGSLFAGEFVQFDGPYMLDGRLLEPIGEFVFTDGLHHPVQHAIEKILADRRPRLPFCSWNDTVDDAAENNIPVDLMRQPGRAEFFDLQTDHICVFAAEQAGYLFGRADVDLGDDLGLAIDPGNLPDVEVGSCVSSKIF